VQIFSGRAAGRPWNPQSWNRYSYTWNNPLRYTDPTGMYVWGTCSAGKRNQALQFLDATALT